MPRPTSGVVRATPRYSLDVVLALKPLPTAPGALLVTGEAPAQYIGQAAALHSLIGLLAALTERRPATGPIVLAAVGAGLNWGAALFDPVSGLTWCLDRSGFRVKDRLRFRVC